MPPGYAHRTKKYLLVFLKKAKAHKNCRAENLYFFNNDKPATRGKRAGEKNTGKPEVYLSGQHTDSIRGMSEQHKTMAGQNAACI